MTIQFEAGKTYQTRSIVDADYMVRVTVVSRTAKTIKTDKGKVLRIAEYNGVEQVKPWGSYSMCPIRRRGPGGGLGRTHRRTGR